MVGLLSRGLWWYGSASFDRGLAPRFFPGLLRKECCCRLRRGHEGEESPAVVHGRLQLHTSEDGIKKEQLIHLAMARTPSNEELEQ